MANRRVAKTPIAHSSAAKNSTAYSHRDRVRRFTKKHYKWFVLFGGLVISLTLSLKERLQEREKDLIATIEAKRDHSELRELITSSSLQIVDLEHMVSSIKSTETTSPEPPGFADAMESFRRKVNELSLTVGETSALAELIYDDPDVSSKLAALKIEVNKSLIDYRSALYNADMYFDHPTDPNNTTFIQNKALHLDDLRNDALRLKRVVEEKLEDRKRLYERQAITVSFVSYALLCVGFLLSVGGQLIGKPGEVPEIRLE